MDQDFVSNPQSAQVSQPQASTASPVTTTQQPQSAQPQQLQQTQPAQPQQQQTTVSAPGTSTTVGTQQQQQPQPEPRHITMAKRVRDIGEILAGGPRTEVVTNPDGTPGQRRAPLTRGQIAMSIALEAISGGLAGLRAQGPNHVGQAAAMGMQQGIQNAQLRRENEDRQYQQARQAFEDRSKQLANKASIAEVNSRTMLNTSEAEHYGLDALNKLIEINRPALDMLDNDAIEARNVTQAELLDGMQRGDYNGTDHLGPIDGVRQVTGLDGTSRYEATHVVIKDPNVQVDVTPEMYERYAAAGVPGFPPTVSDKAKSFTVKYSTIQRANEQLSAHTLADYRLDDLREVLQGTPYAGKVPTSVDFKQPGVVTALSRFQRYVSHADVHGMDIYESLQAMGTAKRNPDGAMQPNPDAKFVDQIAQTFGGWPVLEAAHNQLAANKKAATDFAVIDSEAKANAVLASPGKFSGDQVTSAKAFLALSEQQGARKAAEEARNRAVAEGRDVEVMFKTGINPVTKERLTLDNAPDSMLVDSKGRPVPRNQQALYKPSAQEKQTADTARQALAISADLRNAVRANPDLVGPLLGNSKKGLAKLGLGDAQAQKLLDDVSFLQSAATKVHTGRFSNEILKKMSGMIAPEMNVGQFLGGLNSMDEVMNRYSVEDKLITVADYKAMNGTAPATQGLSNIQINPTTKQQIGWDGKQWVDVQSRQPVR